MASRRHRWIALVLLAALGCGCELRPIVIPPGSLQDDSGRPSPADASSAHDSDVGKYSDAAGSDGSPGADVAGTNDCDEMSTQLPDGAIVLADGASCTERGDGATDASDGASDGGPVTDAPDGDAGVSVVDALDAGTTAD